MSVIILQKKPLRWLFGGFGFHNSEASMTPVMSDEFKYQRVFKSFREISPSFSRVFAGYADWTKKAMDDFADFYDETFRLAQTTLYVVPGRMPFITGDESCDDYAEKVALNLKYLINERNCNKIRYYCVTNELSVGNTYAFLGKNLELFRKYHEALFRAFRRHGLDIGLMATDASGVQKRPLMDWTIQNMDELTDTYCMHQYSYEYDPGDLRMYPAYLEEFSEMVTAAGKKEKRFVLGEYGFMGHRDYTLPMGNDTCYDFCVPEDANRAAISRAEIALAALNAGCLAAVNWTLFDYPDPFLREDGDSAEEKAIYQVARFSGHGLQFRYNKNGVIRWCDDEHDYSARPALYTMGYLTKLFRKGARVLEAVTDDETLRVGSVTNPDGSLSIAVINWGAEKDITVQGLPQLKQPLRQIVYDSENVPENAFNDLQPFSELLSPKGNAFIAKLPANSITFFTTDYVDRKPSPVKNIIWDNGLLSWTPSQDKEHCYYRVFMDKQQIASTVATSIPVCKEGNYSVFSVDKYGNAFQ